MCSVGDIVGSSSHSSFFDPFLDFLLLESLLFLKFFALLHFLLPFPSFVLLLGLSSRLKINPF